MSAGDRAVATPSQTVGPFFHFGLTAEPNGRLVDRLTDDGGEVVALRFSVRDGDDAPVIDAMIELSQSGVVGRMPTDGEGTCEFQTRRPAAGDGGAAHIDVQIFARGLLRQLHTRLYFRGDPGLDADPVLALVPPDRRDTLLAAPSATAGVWTFDVRLQGGRETVFFDL